MTEGLAKIRHARSRKDFPFLKLDDDEYVEFAFRRAKVCLFMIVGGVTVGLILALLIFLIVLVGQGNLDEMGRNFVFIILAALVVFAILAGVVAFMIYNGNRFFITNKRVIQMVMKSPMATSFNMIDLGSVEDASFGQNGLMQKLFHYGTLRLSTIGDETTYTFPYSDILPSELREVSKMITEAKKKTIKNKD